MYTNDDSVLVAYKYLGCHALSVVIAIYFGRQVSLSYSDCFAFFKFMALFYLEPQFRVKNNLCKVFENVIITISSADLKKNVYHI